MKVWPAAIILLLAIGAAYSNALHGPFVFDDLNAITANPTIRHLGSAEVLAPPAGLTVSGRPLLNLSLALNHAIGGADVRGYHVTNVLIHIFAALTLFGLLRRTLAAPRQRNVQFENDSSLTEVALGGTLIWALHPLQTESVTYVIQRAESLMGLFYLLTLYCFVRAVAPAGVVERGAKTRSTLWLGGSVVACAAGMATKEVMVTAPLLVLLYDRIFIAGSWGEIRQRRPGFYLGLAATWLILGALVWPNAGRAGTAGFATGVSMGEYAVTQCCAVLHYLRLAIWPRPLVFDYGEYEPLPIEHALSCASLLCGLLGAAIFVGRRRPAAGFTFAAFFLVLAPTSSVLPISTEPMAEHRMYLPLAALIAVAITTCPIPTRIRAGAMAILALACGLLTFQRNEVYRSERELWTATVAAAPRNPRAHGSLARSLLAAGDIAATETHFRTALALRPDYVDAHYGLGEILTDRGNFTAAAAEYQAVVRMHPDDFIALHALGGLSFQRGDFRAARDYFEHALRIRPDSAAAHNNLGCVLFESGDLAGARLHEEIALRLQPDYAEALYNLGNVHARQGESREACASYERALQLAPNYAEAHINLAAVRETLGDRAAAVTHYEAALRVRPDNAFAREHLAALLAQKGNR